MAYSNPSQLVYLVLSPIISTVLAAFNIVTIFIFCRRFQLSTLSIVVIVNICVCDILVCLISNTFYVANLWHPVYAWTTGNVACKLFKFLTMLCNVAQIHLLCFLNADRLRRLVCANAKQWQKKHGLIFIAISWTAATVLCIPRLAIYEEIEKNKYNHTTNITITMNVNCKPEDVRNTTFIASTVCIFVLAYALPACFIVYTLLHSQAFMHLRRFRVHIINPQNAAMRMNSRLALTFNLTGVLFMAIWTPFFVLSLLDINSDLLESKRHADMNFSLRCTLLILGSAKPFIYLVCLDKFRKSFNCGRHDASETENTSSANRPGNNSSGVNRAQVMKAFLSPETLTKTDVSTV